jgi:hypothetical protein
MDDPNTGELEIKRHGYGHFINVDILLYVDTPIHHCCVWKSWSDATLLNTAWIHLQEESFHLFLSFDRPHQDSDSRMSF